MRWRRGVPCVLGLALLACPREAPVPDAGPGEFPVTSVPGTPLLWRLPATWTVAQHRPAGGGQAPSAAGTRVEDAGAPAKSADLLAQTTLVAEGQRSTADRPSTLPPRVEVYVNGPLPKEATISDYLVANRQAQARALGDITVRHLEVEPIRRSGRAGFHLRDAFDVPLPQGGQAPVSQQAVLLVDGERGYVIVVTLLEDELSRHAEELRTWLHSIRFNTP